MKLCLDSGSLAHENHLGKDNCLFYKTVEATLGENVLVEVVPR